MFELVAMDMMSGAFFIRRQIPENEFWNFIYRTQVVVYPWRTWYYLELSLSALKKA